MNEQRIRTVFVAVLAVVFSLGVVGCDEDRGVGGSETGAIQAEPQQLTFSHVDVGDSEIETLRLRNTSESEVLRLFDIELTAGDTGHVDQLEIVDMPGLDAELQPQEAVEVDVEYTPTPDAPANRGEIRVRNSDPSVEDNILVVPVSTLGNEPEFFADPGQVRFQRMTPGESTEQQLRITNVGTGPMTIHEHPWYEGGEDFQLADTDRDFPLELQPYDSVQAQENSEDYELILDVVYAPLGDGEETGVIVVETDDVDDPPPADGEVQRHEVDVLADADAPCIEVDGRTRNFGQVPIGEVSYEQVSVTNCGSQTLEINDVVLREDDDNVFGLELGVWDQTGDATMDSTVSLEPEETNHFEVMFNPVEEGTRSAELVIANNDPIQPELVIDLTARGADGTCPEAVATAQVAGTPTAPAESITAAPLDDVVLDGTESTDEEAEIIEWEWTEIESPPGTSIEFESVEDDESVVQFQPLTAGDYVVGLEVRDDTGFHSCEQAEVEISAIPDQSIHVELTWSNPEAPQGLDGGSDMDLHLVKMGPGEWFGLPYSVYYNHPNEQENDIWGPEDPSLDIDIRDGEGPENITMDTPDHCQWYAVGAHAYDDSGFGTTFNTVRIYINGDLRYARTHFPLEQTGEFWDVARIHWDEQASDATILPVDGHYTTAPVDEEPEVTDEMINHEPHLCTSEDLY